MWQRHLLGIDWMSLWNPSPFFLQCMWQRHLLGIDWMSLCVILAHSSCSACNIDILAYTEWVWIRAREILAHSSYSACDSCGSVKGSGSHPVCPIDVQRVAWHSPVEEFSLYIQNRKHVVAKNCISVAFVANGWKIPAAMLNSIITHSLGSVQLSDCLVRTQAHFCWCRRWLPTSWHSLHQICQIRRCSWLQHLYTHCRPSHRCWTKLVLQLNHTRHQFPKERKKWFI